MTRPHETDFDDIDPNEAAKLLDDAEPDEDEQEIEQETEQETELKPEPEKGSDGKLDRLEQMLDGLLDRAREVSEGSGRKSDARPEVDQDLEEALQDDDPRVRTLAERVKSTHDRLSRLEQAIQTQSEAAELERFDGEVKAVKEKFDITDQQVADVVKWMAENPSVAQALSFEQAVRAQLADLRTRAKSDPTPAENGARGSRRTATIISDNASGGSNQPKAFKPGPGHDFEDVGAHILSSVFRQRG